MHETGDETTGNTREILGLIFEKNRIRWKRSTSAILKNEVEAEDVVHDAVRRTLARNHTFNSVEHAHMYLTRAINNVALERYRGMKRAKHRLLPANETIYLPSKGTSPHDFLEQVEQSIEQERLLALVREGLRQLPPKQYEALRLTILEGPATSIRDVGMNNGIPYSTLRHRSKQGLRRLRRFLLSHYRRMKETGTRIRT